MIETYHTWNGPQCKLNTEMPLRSIRFSTFARYIFKRIIVYQHDNTCGYQERPRGEKETPPPFRQHCLCLKD